MTDTAGVRRIVVIGHPGAGKSTLAARLGPILNLPVYHLDRYFWKPGWIESDRTEFRERLIELLAGESWIIDGSYSATLPLRLQYADTVIHLDFPRLLCMWRLNRRVLESFGRVRPDMADGCPERFDWPFLQWCWRYRRRHRPLILSALEEADRVRVITLVNPVAVREYVAGLGGDLLAGAGRGAGAQ